MVNDDDDADDGGGGEDNDGDNDGDGDNDHQKKINERIRRSPWVELRYRQDIS